MQSKVPEVGTGSPRQDTTEAAQPSHTSNGSWSLLDLTEELLAWVG